MRSRAAAIAGFAATLAVLVLGDAASARAVPRQWGRTLFERVWEARDVAALPDGDGLGPAYDDVSCVACHRLGGAGGAGDAEHNAVLGVDARGIAYRHAPRFVLPVSGALALPRAIEQPRERPLVERNAPALFGAGLLDDLTDAVLLAAEAQQARAAEAAPVGDVPQGRVPRTATGAIGRFGWKGQTATLADAVDGACVYLGLATSTHRQAGVPDAPHGDGSAYVRALVVHSGGTWPESPIDGIDLSERDLAALTHHVAKLPRPRAAKYDDVAITGEALFVTIGCTACHTPSLGGIDGLYADLLLHQMGPRLADGARSADVDGRVPRGDGEASAFEWRTPPLWGLSASAPYLHDGRAATIEAAIRMHGGEATAAKYAYGELTDQERVQVLHFLGGLAPPDRLAPP